ncbi:MAG: hypothetical protein AAGB22_08475 [Bacteroidota bacterium]
MKKSALHQDDLVEVLAPDAGNVDSYQLLYGWLGKSTRKGYVRLYDDIDLRVYVEFSEAEVHLTKSLQTTENPLGGTLVWLSADAKVITTGQEKTDIQERSFLQGDFAQEMGALERDLNVNDGTTAMAAGLTRSWKCCKKPKPFLKTIFWGSCRPCCW